MRTLPFSAKAEYACVAMLELAAHYGDPQPVRLRAIADAHHIPQRFLVQILLQLKGSGLVISARGAAGGYLLARSPKTITLADVLNVIDRPDRPAPDRRANSGGPPSPMSDALRAIWKEIQAAQRRILEGTSLADLAQKAREGQSLMYQI
ncbi:MAG TPA: Rrf2 family transcriptional regulator [Gemmataceae bacterium]|jgi:Rrf2 family protein|nr:Rrf2 family transcriptional regulator [Gemmataceae bacterium]